MIRAGRGPLDDWATVKVFPSGDPQEDLVGIAAEDALRQRLDGLRLVAGGLEFRRELKAVHR